MSERQKLPVGTALGPAICYLCGERYKLDWPRHRREDCEADGV